MAESSGKGIVGSKGLTFYSDWVGGDTRNGNRSVRVDDTDGYIGITQASERVLLTPQQVRALIKFIGRGVVV